jgi:putative ABC transport system ATP-binding protein
VLKVQGLRKIYGEGAASVSALKDVSFEVAAGEFVAIMGPSGSGKSTLLNIIGGLDYPTAGDVILDGTRINSLSEDSLVKIRRGKIGYIFQEYHLIPSLTALENVLLPMTFSGARNGTNEAVHLLEKLELGDRLTHKPGQLSGGEQQRVAIARALITNPVLTLADEPTGNLDQKTGCDILELFAELNAEGHSIIMVTHNPEAARYAGKTITLRDGSVFQVEEIK